MKKSSWKLVLCLALAVVMLACTALAAIAQEDVAAASGTTITVSNDGKLTVEVSGLTGPQYVLMQVKVNSNAATPAALLADPPSYDVGEDTILYIDQDEVTSGKLTFSNFLPKSAATSLFVLGGDAEPKIVGAMVAQGVTVSGTVTAKEGSNPAATVTVTAGDVSEEVTLTNGAGNYTLSGVATDVTTLTASSGTKFVAREYAIDASADVTQNIVLNPKGDTVQDGTGTVSIQDVNALYAHTQRNGAKLTGYALDCGKVLGSDTVSIQDVNALYAHTQRNGAKLW